MTKPVTLSESHRRINEVDDAYHRMTGRHLITAIRRPEPRVSAWVWEDGTETTTVAQTALRLSEALVAHLRNQVSRW
jgi:hypothetical protein